MANTHKSNYPEIDPTTLTDYNPNQGVQFPIESFSTITSATECESCNC